MDEVKRQQPPQQQQVTKEDQPQVANVVSDETGQLDARFMLWRQFCVDNNVPVETLPGDLNGEVKEKWEKVKDDMLHKPAEQS